MENLTAELKATRESVDALRKSRRWSWIATGLLGALLLGFFGLAWNAWVNEEEEDRRDDRRADENFLAACERNNEQQLEQGEGYSDLIEGILIAFPNLEQETIDGLRQGVENARSNIEIRDCEQELADRNRET